MKNKSLLMATAMFVGLSMASAQDATTPAKAPAKDAPAAQSTPLTKEFTKEYMSKNISYLFGYQTGQQLSQAGPIEFSDLDAEALIAGLKAGISGERPAISEEEVGKAFEQFQTVLKERVEAKSKANIEAGKKFLEENAKKPGVVTTKSGLQYRVIEKGGDKKYEEPKDGDKGTRFLVNYKGTLPDGTVFDETNGNPVEMPLQVIPGFGEALKMMPVGAKWELVLPSDLAYGAQGAGAKIGPNQTLIFELELKDILPPDPNAQQQMPQLTPEQLQELMQQAGQNN